MATEPTGVGAQPGAPSEPAAPTPEPTLQEWRAQRDARLKGEAPAPEPAPEPAASAEPAAPAAAAEPPEPPEDPEAEPTGTPAPVAESHRWKDPETGVRLDLRRRDHRRIKALLEEGHRTAQENAELRRRIAETGQPAAQPPAQPATAQARPQPADPSDPEPTLDDFANEADPYLAYSRALARWDARQEFKQQSTQRASVERAQRQQAQVTSWQAAFDEKAQAPEVRSRYPDFDAAHEALIAALPKDGRAKPLVARILRSPIGHDVAHYLGTHPDAVQALYRVPPAEHLVAIGALETRVQAQLDAAKATPAHPSPPPAAPIPPTGSRATTTTFDPETSNDLAEWRRRKGVKGGYRVSA